MLILQAHTLTALLNTVEHMILIGILTLSLALTKGDHMQLRPHAQNYELSMENKRKELNHNLDISLFERLCTAGIRSTSENNLQFPYTVLTVQRRMRPEIADLVRIPLYPNLEDHPTVHEYPQVPGMYYPLYWLDHSESEEGAGDLDIKGTSHSNDYEVEMVRQLVLHLSKQGCYGAGEIAVITPYVGQLRKLRNVFQSAFAVHLSEKDQEELEEIEESELETWKPTVERKALSQSVRIATVFPVVAPNIDLPRWIIFKEKKQKSLWFL